MGKLRAAACHSFIGSTLEVLDNHLNAVGVFLHLAEAYDIPNHQILLKKLQIYRVRGVQKSWLNHIHQTLVSLLTLQKLVTVILCIDTLPYLEKQLIDFPRVQC